jgi:hypothetical protein
VPWRSTSGTQYVRTPLAAPDGVRSKLQPQRSLPPFNATADLSGGFYEDGPFGPVKLTKSNALSMALLAWALLDARDAFDADAALQARSAPLRPQYAPVVKQQLSTVQAS